MGRLIPEGALAKRTLHDAQRGLLLAVLLALIALLAYRLLAQPEQKEPIDGSASQHIPDYFLHGATITQMNASGQPEQRLLADTLVHYADNGSMELSAPRLTLYSENAPAAPPWQLDAARALIAQDGKDVHLTGGVHISQQRPSGALELLTERMLLRPDEQYAETSAPLTLTEPGIRVDAVGMRYWMDKGRLELLAQVRGIHDPTR